MTITLPFFNQQIPNPFDQHQIDAFRNHVDVRRAENPEAFESMKKTVLKIATIVTASLLALISLPIVIPVITVASFLIGTPLTYIAGAAASVAGYNAIRSATRSLDQQMPYVREYIAAVLTPSAAAAGVVGATA